MSKKIATFTVTVQDQTGNDKELELAIMKPDAVINAKARAQQSKAFREAMDAGAPLRAKMDQFVRDQGVWDDEMEQRFVELSVQVVENETIINKGGCQLTDGYHAAIALRRARNEIALLLQQRNDLDQYTCEGQGDNARFDSLVSQAVVDNTTGKPFFKSYEDYLDQKDTEAGSTAARIFGEAFYGIKDDYYKSLPENKFLLQFGFCNDDLHLVDKQGRLIDTYGRLVNENGERINEEGQLVDDLGNPIDEEGNPIGEQAPFLDEDGNPLGPDGKPIEQEEEPEPSPAQKKKPVKKTASQKKKAVKKKTE